MNNSKYHLSTPMGIHRVMREPYDDREVFESMDDLWTYAHTGTRYNGQRVACIIGTPGVNNGYIQNFTINHDFPIIDLPNGEIITDKYNRILLYYYNPFKFSLNAQTMFNEQKDHYNYLRNPFKFSILSLIKAFRRYALEKYTITLVKTSKSSVESNTIDIEVTELESIIYGTQTEVFYTYTDSANGEVEVTITKGGTNYEITIGIKYGDAERSYGMFPKLSGSQTSIVEMYLSANNYIEAMGGTYG